MLPELYRAFALLELSVVCVYVPAFVSQQQPTKINYRCGIDASTIIFMSLTSDLLLNLYLFYTK